MISRRSFLRGVAAAGALVASGAALAKTAVTGISSGATKIVVPGTARFYRVSASVQCASRLSIFKNGKMLTTVMTENPSYPLNLYTGLVECEAGDEFTLEVDNEQDDDAALHVEPLP